MNGSKTSSMTVGISELVIQNKQLTSRVSTLQQENATLKVALKEAINVKDMFSADNFKLQANQIKGRCIACASNYGGHCDYLNFKNMGYCSEFELKGGK